MSGKAFNLSKGVFSFNGRKGNVLPKSGDYTAEMVGALSSNSTGDNIPVSQSDVTSISAALSNKATNLGNVSSPYETVLDAVLSCTTDSSFFVDNASSLHNATDAPWRQNETQYFVSVDGVKSRRIVFAVLYGSNVQQFGLYSATSGCWIGHISQSPPRRSSLTYRWRRGGQAKSGGPVDMQ